MTDPTPDDLDATPPYGIAGGTRSGGSFGTSRIWLAVVGVLLALMVLTLLIRLS